MSHATEIPGLNSVEEGTAETTAGTPRRNPRRRVRSLDVTAPRNVAWALVLETGVGVFQMSLGLEESANSKP